MACQTQYQAILDTQRTCPNHAETIPEPVPHQPKHTPSKKYPRSTPKPFQNHPGNTQGLPQPHPNHSGIISERILNRPKHSQTTTKPISKPLADHSRTRSRDNLERFPHNPRTTPEPPPRHQIHFEAINKHAKLKSAADVYMRHCRIPNRNTPRLFPKL